MPHELYFFIVCVFVARAEYREVKLTALFSRGTISLMKWFQNLLVLAAGIPILIAGLIAVAVLFLGASGTVLARRLRLGLVA